MWIVLETVVIVTLASVLLSMRQASHYEASADVLLRSQSLPSALAGVPDPNAPSYYVDPAHVASTQVAIARLPVMATRVVNALRPPGMTGTLLGSSSVSPVPGTDFSVSRFRGATLHSRRCLRTGTPASTRSTARGSTRSLSTPHCKRCDRGSGSSARRRRTGTRKRARTAEQGRQSSARGAPTGERSRRTRGSGAAEIGPNHARAGLLGLAPGLVLGLGLALLLEAVDTRLRSAEEIGAILDLPLLARLPDPGRRLRRANQLAMVEAPNSVSAEAFRIMRANLEFTSLGREAHAIMITSARAGEGESTTAGNLAVALARAGSRVVVVDLDLRRPGIAPLFGLEFTRSGLTDVVLGHATLDQTLVGLQLGSTATAPGGAAAGNGSSNGNSHPISPGVVEVLPAGPLPPNPGGFVGSAPVRSVIGALRDRADFVIVDAPPALQVGDAMTIAGFVDAVVLVVNPDIARRPVVAEFAHVVRARLRRASASSCAAAPRPMHTTTTGTQGRRPRAASRPSTS